MSKLAIDGGEKAITVDQKCLEWPIIPEDAKETVIELLNEVPAKVSLGEITSFFADEFSDYIDCDFAIPLNNGTAGLFSAYAALGIGPGDEIISPSYTYWASVMPASFLGAKIVFAEIEKGSLCIDPVDIRKKITDKTKAITVVHVWGVPANMDEIMKISKEFNIPIIEDASHAHGATYHGKKIGSLGKIGVFSLQGSKLMPAGEGGLMVMDDQELFEKCLAIGHYDRVKSMAVPDDSPYKKYGATTSHGFKFRMSPLHAAIGLSYLETLDEDNELRNKNCNRVRNALKNIKGFTVYDVPDDVGRVFYENLVEYDPEVGGVPTDKLIETLKAEGVIITKNRYFLVHGSPYFLEKGHKLDELPKSDEYTKNLITIPKFSVDNDELVDQYIAAFEKVAAELLK